MRSFDHDVAVEFTDRLGRVANDARPAWGSLTPAGMVRHLSDTVRYSMGKAGSAPFYGNWFSRHVIGPLIIHGILRMPKNVKLPEGAPQPETPGPLESELETLHAVLEEYLSQVQSGEFTPAIHPYFGEIGIDGWSKLHVVHFEHHLKQYGL
ncbi:MAG: DUF1569 domain-containing protein [bacterium]|nr:DUF1569 domain-containing protein [bacterium]